MASVNGDAWPFRVSFRRLAQVRDGRLTAELPNEVRELFLALGGGVVVVRPVPDAADYHLPMVRGHCLLIPLMGSWWSVHVFHGLINDR